MSLYFMNMHLTEVKLQEAAQKLFSDKSCGNVFRVKGFMKNEKEQWIELNATQKNLVISPIKMGQEVIIVDRGTAGGGCNPQLSGSIGS